MWSRRLLRRVRCAGCGVAELDTLFAWIDNGQTRGEFTQALTRFIAADASGPRRLVGTFRQQSGVNVANARNIVAAEFLDHPARPEWLFMCDADMSAPPGDFYRLLDLCDPTERPIVGGVCVGYEPLGSEDYDTFLTVYRLGDEGPQRWSQVPDDTLIRTHATGAAFLVVHRSVFEKLQELHGDKVFWAFAEGEVPFGDRSFAVGEDTLFCIRAGAAGFPVHVHSGIVPNHHKGPLVLNMDTHRRKQAEYRTTVILPVKDRLDLTSRLLNELKDQGGFDRVVVFDNGSERKTRNWLQSQQWFDTFDAAGASIHEMWNAGIAESLVMHPRVNIAFLNNDLELGPRFLPGLAEALRSDPYLAAVSPNYDGRTGPTRVIPVHGIAAGKEDGTGGLAGFAFMVRGELFRETGYRFPEWARWWFGDTDFALTCDALGLKLGVVRDTTVTHVHGGSQTSRPDWWDEQIKQDEAGFWAKWGEHIKKLEAAE